MDLKKKIFSKAFWSEKWELFVIRWNGVTSGQKMGVFALVLSLFVLPLSVLLVLNPVKLFSRASPVTPPTIPPITPPLTCSPRPICLDGRPPCLIPEPVSGWCPTATPTPMMSIAPSQTPGPTATPIMTVMPTQIPVSTPTRTPALTPTRTPVSTPVSNTKPQIISTNLGTAIVGRPYSYKVYGYDADKDTLTMNFSNLPLGISKTDCAYDGRWYDVRNGTKITCTLSGTPKVVGTYTVRVILIDGKGLSVSKNLILNVTNKRTFSLPI